MYFLEIINGFKTILLMRIIVKWKAYYNTDIDDIRLIFQREKFRKL